jgi:hypothetical protein
MIKLQDILHMLDKLGICLCGNAPLLLDPGFEFVGQQDLTHRLVADRFHLANSTNWLASNRNVQRAAPSGGALHASAIRYASCVPSGRWRRAR